MKILHRYFIPHDANEYRPHFLRSETVFAILAVLLLVEGAFLSQALIFGPQSGFLALILPNTLVDQTNQNRIAANLSTLAVSPLLTAAAQEKADDMAAAGYFAHTSPTGVTPWHWFDQVGYKYTYAGENLAVNFSDSQDVETAWMNSPDHRANILNPHYTEIGIATAQGTYNGSPTVYVVQLFGRPAPVAAAKPAPTTVATKPAPAPKPVIAPTPKPVAVIPTPAPQANAVAVQGAATEAAGTAATAGSTPQSAPESNFVQRILAAPRSAMNFLYLLLGGVVVLALFLNIFIKMSVQHPRLVLNGLMILLALGTLAVFNQHLLLANARIF